MSQYPRNCRCYPFLWPDHARQYFERIKCNRNAGAVPKKNVHVRDRMFFPTVDAYLPVVFTVSGRHIFILV